MVKILKILFILLIFIFAENSAQQVAVLASVDSSDYLVGDYINYTLEVIADKNIQIISPSFRDSLKEVEIIREFEPSSTEIENGKSAIYVFTISYYDSGSITIPPIAVNYI